MGKGNGFGLDQGGEGLLPERPNGLQLGAVAGDEEAVKFGVHIADTVLQIPRRPNAGDVAIQHRRNPLLGEPGVPCRSDGGQEQEQAHTRERREEA